MRPRRPCLLACGNQEAKDQPKAVATAARLFVPDLQVHLLRQRWQPLQLQLPPSAPLPRFHSEWRRSARARGLGGPPELPGPGPAALGFGLSRRPTSKHASGGTTRPVSWAFQGLPETSLSCEKHQPAAAPCEGRAGLRKGSDRAAVCLQKYQSRTGPERRHATGLGDPPPQCRPAYPLAGAHQTSTSQHSDPALRTRLASLELSQRLASLVDPRRRPASRCIMQVCPIWVYQRHLGPPLRLPPLRSPPSEPGWGCTGPITTAAQRVLWIQFPLFALPKPSNEKSDCDRPTSQLVPGCCNSLSGAAT